MARREVKSDDIPKLNFVKYREVFNKDGAKWGGIVEEVAPNAGNPGLDIKPSTNVTLKKKDGSLETMSISGVLEKQVKKIAPRPGEKMVFTRTGSTTTNAGNTQLIISVVCDTPENAPPPPPPADEDDGF